VLGLPASVGAGGAQSPKSRYEFVKESVIADFGVRKLNEIKGQILWKSIFSQSRVEGERGDRRNGESRLPAAFATAPVPHSVS
jgi:hypothetical protein